MEKESDKLKFCYKQLETAQKEFNDNKTVSSDDLDVSKMHQDHQKREIDSCLNHLELIDFVRKRGLVPSVLSQENLGVNDQRLILFCKQYMQDNGYIFRSDSYIIETNMSLDYDTHEMLKPVQDKDEMEDLIDLTISPEVRADLESDVAGDNPSNKRYILSELDEKNEEPSLNKRSRSEQSDTGSSHESLAITSSPRVINNFSRPSQRISTTSSLSQHPSITSSSGQRPSIASSSNSNPRQPSRLSIE